MSDMMAELCLGLIIAVIGSTVAFLVARTSRALSKRRELANTIFIEDGIKDSIVEEKHPIWVVPGTWVEGDITAPKVRVAGLVRGNITASEAVGVLEGGSVIGQLSAPAIIIHEGASVEGDLFASRICVGGQVTGDVTASETVEVLSSGSIIGELATQHLLLCEGAYVSGITVETV